MVIEKEKNSFNTEGKKYYRVHQFGFREKHGTIEQVNRISGEIRKSLNIKDIAQLFSSPVYTQLLINFLSHIFQISSFE